MSGVLHLPNEINNPMAADHHTVCKFESKDDPGFKDIRNVLVKLVAPFISEGWYYRVITPSCC
jgi:hypothetical protein